MPLDFNQQLQLRQIHENKKAREQALAERERRAREDILSQQRESRSLRRPSLEIGPETQRPLSRNISGLTEASLRQATRPGFEGTVLEGRGRSIGTPERPSTFTLRPEGAISEDEATAQGLGLLQRERELLEPTVPESIPAQKTIKTGEGTFQWNPETSRYDIKVADAEVTPLQQKIPDSIARKMGIPEGSDLTFEQASKAGFKLEGEAKKDFDKSQKLRNEFTSKSKDFIQTRDSFARVQASAKDPSAAGDLALIFNYMKILDPGSTVREGEFATAQNSAGVPAKIIAKYNQIRRGERLEAGQRDDFVDRAGRLFNKQVKQHDQRISTYTTLSKSFGLDVQDVVVDLTDTETLREAGLLKTPTSGTGQVPEGTIITNKTTGERLVKKGGQWQTI